MSEIDYSSFSVRRMLTISTRVLTQFRRDKRTFGMIVIMPMIIMLVFGIALSGEVKNVTVAIDNQDEGGLVNGQFVNTGLGIVLSLEQDDRINLREQDYDTSTKKVEKAELSAAIRIPIDFTSKLSMKANGTTGIELIIEIYIDATKPAIRGSIIAAIQDALSTALKGESIQFEQQLAFNGAETTGLDVAIPAVMGFVLTFLILLLSSLTMVRENVGGTQFRLYTTPINKMERLLGYVVALTFFGFVEVSAILVISILLFGVAVKGSILLLIFFGFWYAVAHILLAVFLSNFAENELQAMQMVPLIALPSMALSGMLVPVASLPAVAQTISNFVPLTYGITLFEGVMLKGFGFGELWLEFLKLSIFVIGFFLLSLLTIKDHDES